MVAEGNSFGLQPNYFLNKILNHESCEPDSIWIIISENEFLLQNDYLEMYFVSIPDKYVNHVLLEKLIEFYRTTHFEYLDFRPDNLIKFEGIEENIFFIIIKILWGKTKNGENISFDLVFNPYSGSFKNLEIIFRNDVELLKEIYFYENQRIGYSDHNGAVYKIILKLDSNFIIEFLENKYKGKRFLTRHDNDLDLRILWTLENYEEILSGVFEYHIHNNLSDFSHFLSSFFIIPEKEDFKERRKKFFNKSNKKIFN